MKTLRYVFWKFWKFRVQKENDMDSAYLSVTLFLGIFILGIPMLVILKASYSYLPILPKNKLLQYIIAIPIVFLCSVPFRFLFPKKQIFDLKYTDYEMKKYNTNIIIMTIFIVIIIILNVFVLK